MPKIIISPIVYKQLMNHVCSTDFQYETGGVLLGYRFLRIFYIIGITFPRHFEGATRTTFILNGEEHAEDAKKIVGRFMPNLQLIGIWHSHTTKDDSFSLQDREANKLFAGEIGRMLSVIVIQKSDTDNIRLIPYYISEKGEEFLCKHTIQGGKYMSNQKECCSNCVCWIRYIGSVLLQDR